MQVTNRSNSIKKASPTPENIHTPSAAPAEAMFSNAVQQTFETMHTRGCVLFHLYVFIVVETTRNYLLYVLLRTYILSLYTFLEFVSGSLDSAAEQLP